MPLCNCECHHTGSSIIHFDACCDGACPHCGYFFVARMTHINEKHPEEEKQRLEKEKQRLKGRKPRWSKEKRDARRA